MNSIDKLVLKIVSLKNKGGKTQYELPITEINGFKVDCVQIFIPRVGEYNGFTHPHQNEILLKIDTEYLPDSIYYEWYSFTKETAKESIKNIVEVIKNLQLDKTTNQLKDKRTKTEEDIISSQDLYDIFACENVKLKYDECCVCNDITNSYFRECKHTICFECCSKLKIENDCVICPICRNEACVGSCESDRSDTILDTY